MATPQIDATGVYTVKEPFVIADGDIYKCEGIYGFEALESMCIDIFACYYEPVDLTIEELAEDRNNNVNIVTLIPVNGGPALHIPSSYILTVPVSSVIPYNRLIVSLDLGLLPDELELSSMMEAIRDAASDITGVLPKVKLHRVAVSGGIDPTKHKLLETNRKLAQRYRNTAHSEVKKLVDLIAKKEEYIALMEEVMQSVCPENP